MRRKRILAGAAIAATALLLGSVISAQGTSVVKDPAAGVLLVRQPETATLADEPPESLSYGPLQELAPGEWQKVDAARQRGEWVELVEDENGELRVNKTGTGPIPQEANPAWEDAQR